MSNRRHMVAASLATLIVSGTTVAANAGIEATHEVPEWMTTVCAYEDSVNCWFDGGTGSRQEGVYIRKMPKSNKVCYIFETHSKWDYCERVTQ